MQGDIQRNRRAVSGPSIGDLCPILLNWNHTFASHMENPVVLLDSQLMTVALSAFYTNLVLFAAATIPVLTTAIHTFAATF